MKLSEAIALVVGVGVVGLVCYNSVEQSKTCKRIGMAADRISNSSDIQIDEALVDSVTREVVARRAEKACETAEKSVISRFRDEIAQQVKSAVNYHAAKTADKVAEEITAQASRIDHDYLLKRAIEKAADKAQAKFDEKLDDFIDKLKDRMDDDDDYRERRRRIIVM